jgi:hypothetical protein
MNILRGWDLIQDQKLEVLFQLQCQLSFKRENMTIFMSKRAILSHITKEIIHGMRMNLTIVMRKTGIKKPKIQL